MENSQIKVCQMERRKVAQDILKSVWIKQDIPFESFEPDLTLVPEITEQFMINLCAMVWDETVRKGRVWNGFLENHFNSMAETPYQFAKYVAYASYLSIEQSTNAQACFLDILSLVIQFTLYCWDHGEEYDKFKNMTIELFCAFFDKELGTKFEEQGGWRNFSRLGYVDALSSTGEYVINGVVLKDITKRQVENHQQALSFANSIGDKMKEVYEKEDVLKDFAETDRQLEKLYSERVGVACDGMAGGEDQSSLQKVQDEALKDTSRLITDRQLEKLYCEPVGVACDGMAGGEDQSSLQKVQDEALKDTSRLKTPQNIEDQLKVGGDSDYLETPNVGPSKSLKFVLEPSFKFKNIGKAVALLGEMINDITKISELIKFVCEEN